jgi:hypothetical protein
MAKVPVKLGETLDIGHGHMIDMVILRDLILLNDLHLPQWKGES